MNMWKWPDTVGYAEKDPYPLARGAIEILVPNALVFASRNITLEFLFTGVTAADVSTTVKLYKAIHPDMFAAGNAKEVIDAVTLDSLAVADSTVGFAREIKNMDTGYIKLVISPARSATASLRIWAKTGGAV